MGHRYLLLALVAVAGMGDAHARPVPVRPAGPPPPPITAVVVRVGVPLFTDARCARRLTDAVGVVVEVQHRISIFPTTRSHFRVGQRVAWEWNMRTSWGETFQREPVSGACVQAWLSSAEFIGRPLAAANEIAH